MPNRDTTGPMGMGPGTGRGMGTCCGGGCFGFGIRRGGKRFWMMDKKERELFLKEEAEALKEELQDIEKEIADLEK